MFATASLIVFTLKAGGQSDLFTAVGKLSNPALLGIGVAKDSGQFAEALQGALKKVVENGTYDKIFKSYGYENLELTADQIAINGSKS
jgi:polar amino acid transport system substrate-binding protein